MWGVLSFFRRRRRTARVVDESAVGHRHHAAGADDARAGAAGTATAGGPGALMARALLAMSCVVRLDGEDVEGGGVEEAWATSGWRPPRTDEVSHLMVRERMRYAIYA